MVQLSFWVIPKYEKFTIYDHLMICREIRKEFAVTPVNDAGEGGFDFVNEFHVRTNGAMQFPTNKKLSYDLLVRSHLYKNKYKVLWCLGKGHKLKLGGNIYCDFPHSKFYKVRDVFESLGHLVVCNGDFMKEGDGYVIKKGNHNVMSLKKIEEARLRWKDTERQEVLLRKFPYDIMLEIFKHLKKFEEGKRCKKYRVSF